MNNGWTEVDVYWSLILNEYDPRFRECNRIYLYYQVNPFGHSIFNIGKAVGCTPAQRYNAWDKMEVRKRILKEFNTPTFTAIVGELRRRDGKPVSDSLIADVESLLINRLQPHFNSNNKDSLNVNYILSVECHGAWPLSWKEFFHNGKSLSQSQSKGILPGLIRPSLLGLGSSLADPLPGFLGPVGRPVSPPAKNEFHAFSDMFRMAQALRDPGTLSIMRMFSDTPPKK